MKHPRELFWHYWLPVLIMLTLISIESTDMMSGQHTASHLQSVFLWAGIHLRGRQLELLNMVFRKSGHTIGYGLLCFCWFLLLRGTYWLQHDYKNSLRGSIQMRRMWWRAVWAGLAIFFTFAVATADELHQMSIPSRSGSWWDVTLDTSAGVVLMLLVFAKAVSHCRKRK